MVDDFEKEMECSVKEYREVIEEYSKEVEKCGELLDRLRKRCVSNDKK